MQTGLLTAMVNSERVSDDGMDEDDPFRESDDEMDDDKTSCPRVISLYILVRLLTLSSYLTTPPFYIHERV